MTARCDYVDQMELVALCEYHCPNCWQEKECDIISINRYHDLMVYSEGE